MTDKQLQAFMMSSCLVCLAIVGYSIGQIFQSGEHYLLLVPALGCSMMLLYVIYNTTTDLLIQKELR